MNWTHEATEELKRLYGGLLTAEQIGKRLGCTKGAVIGKANRLGLAQKKPERRKKHTAIHTANTPPAQEGVTLLEVTGCRHEISEGRYCNATIREPYSWCAAHRTRYVRQTGNDGRAAGEENDGDGRSARARGA